MAAVQPDVRFCGLAQVVWIRTVVHYAEVFVRAPRVVARPRDYDRIVRSRFKRGALGNVDAFRLFSGGEAPEQLSAVRRAGCR